MKHRKKIPASPDKTRLPDSFLEVGRVVRPHGVRGLVVIDSEASYFAGLAPGTKLFLAPDNRQVTVQSIRVHQGRFLVSLEGFSSRDDAEAIRNLKVLLNNDDLPELDEDEYFFWQLQGLNVVDTHGTRLGELSSIIQTGANDVYVIRDGEGRERLIPAIKDVINNIDLDRGEISITALPGLFPDDQEA